MTLATMPEPNPSLQPTDLDAQIAAISRGAVEINPLAELKAKLLKSAKEGRPLTIKLGCDPSRPDLHLGHAVVLRKMRQFQDLGHRVVLIIGDFTGMIGDPTGKSKTRPALTLEETRANGRSYFEQATLILNPDPDKLSMSYNSEWLEPLGFKEVIALAAKYTVARMLDRDEFQKRFRQGEPISVHEFLYPLAQAYDSVAIRSDVELGGTDQTFNLLVGRDIQREYGLEPQVVLTMPLLVGLDGVEKMSKSLDNYVGIAEPPTEMFGKLMSLSDAMMPTYFELCTDVPMDEVQVLTDAALTHPREAKKRLAREIVTLYHSQAAAQAADDEFERVHGRGHAASAVPDDIPEVILPLGIIGADGEVKIVPLLVAAGLADSNGEAKRLVQQGGVSVDGVKVSEIGQNVRVETGQVIKVGRTRFVRLLVSPEV